MLNKTVFFLGLGLGLGLAIAHSTAMADTFDDAVALYLKGFDHCTEAKDALTAGNLSQASRALQQYETLKARAVGINDTILSTNKRGMDSNLKFCERVSKDIEIELGTPILNRAIAACDQAQAQLRAKQPEQAKVSYQQFIELKQEALTTSPRLTDQFSTRNQISRCERLEKKITGFSQKQEALALAIDTVVEESEAYNAVCQNALQGLTTNPGDRRSLDDAKAALSNARQHRTAVMTETLALAELEANPSRPEKTRSDQNLAAGDRCMTSLQQRVDVSEASLQQALVELNEYDSRLSKGIEQCRSAQRQTVAQVTPETHAAARGQYEYAVQTRNAVRTALTKSQFYQGNQSTPKARQIDDKLGKLNRCLETTRSHVSELFAALPLTKPATPAEAKQTAAGKNGGVPPKKISGSIKMLDTTPEFVLAYMMDGSAPDENLEITIDSAGFDHPVYMVGNGDTFRIKSKDFSPHRILATNDLLNFSESLARVQSRQSRTARVTWPANTLVQIRSDRGNIIPSYIANIASSRHQLIMFDFGSDTVKFELENPSEAAKGFLLIPGFDPLEINLSEGEIKSLALTRDKEPRGSVLLKGL
ncbi:MAG: hypothetical protein VYA55_10360 [Pseudomonadota bacterium]|nr:hypothetical protein [Pseudomonadota bacterium]